MTECLRTEQKVLDLCGAESNKAVTCCVPRKSRGFQPNAFGMGEGSEFILNKCPQRLDI